MRNARYPAQPGPSNTKTAVNHEAAPRTTHRKSFISDLFEVSLEDDGVVEGVLDRPREVVEVWHPLKTNDDSDLVGQSLDTFLRLVGP